MFISNAISDHEMSFEIKNTVKHNFRLKLGKSKAYWASTQFTRMLINKDCMISSKKNPIDLSASVNPTKNETEKSYLGKLRGVVPV